MRESSTREAVQKKTKVKAYTALSTRASHYGVCLDSIEPASSNMSDVIEMV